MRPSLLNPLFAPITTLAGIGPKLAPFYERLAGGRVVDLLWHLPSGVIDRRFAPKLAEAPAGKVATITVQVEAHFPSSSPKRPYRVRCSDETGFAHLVFFHGREDWLRRQLPDGEWRVISGVVEHFNDGIQITHPDHIVPLAEREQVMNIEPVYPLTGGLTARMVAKTIRTAVDQAPQMPEWQDAAWFARNAWPSWRQALDSLHRPQSEQAVIEDNPARRRLAFDELLANQLALMMVRAHMRKLKGRPIPVSTHLRPQVLAALPFTLTAAQTRSLAEIDADMAEPLRMLRLLQGDVGSGKTVVALLAMLNAVESGAQAALMAPTEILARQHMDTIAPLVEGAGLRVALLTGRDKGKARDAILADLAAGRVQIIIGTHALFQEDVAYADLAFAVIDEQHRFGVHQRLELASKGQAVDMLVMTATPIPRTLLLTSYGDMDASRLDEKPPGRQPVSTRALPLSRMDEVVDGIGRAVKAGARVYWVCPLVEDSETSDLAAAEERHRHLSQVFGDGVGLVHGKMKGLAKDKVMADFAAGQLSVLVATTVIEVGVNVPEATIMVIEHAERFGLAQLHQLRGRVGRGSGASSCLLLYGAPLSENAKARLEIMRATEDGFVIAEEDLRLRGGGEILGTRQSGLPEFKLADLALHGDLLAAARDDAALILARDPELTSERGQALRVLLYLFERDAAVHTLRSG
ncbi:ATP-dependent DNA helicase RecG [Magnetospirillum gryphiswaldense]|uniref:ATP-dependent DNA helicase RecG n=1 Tax=Magnetospirillum gryphiswaldense TaxID=55518 RepID=A4TWW3_9PROT|nr:ATP-dependent DNA helicase RecG [Magnetospirillum gryphiswaldense]AVM73575.1 ATP-dependent DNA helicase RecG [Magnetospirillum gryphiswaldense MSR-1]AVM77478.1 ATP-dependent DNA helicase RecG [Magnetospirillum gryphiswaldense]CAM75120.1 ATP-dependent DNA helicase recG [Magnetospirillum gryphiswaldense MSR-1]